MEQHFVTRFLCVCVVFIVLMGGIVQAGDWPNYRGPDYDGISQEKGWDASKLKDGIEPVWEASIGIGFSAVSVSDGRAYAMGNSAKKKDDKEQFDVVYCFDAETGEELWKHSYDNQLDPKYYEGGTLASPTVSAGKVYTISKDGRAFCLDAKTGDVIWNKDVLSDLGTKRTTWGISGSPLIIENMVIYNAGSWGIALNKDDASVIWKNGEGPGGYATAVPFDSDGKKCIAMFGEKGIRGMVAATGQELWHHKWETKYEVNAADPVISGDKVFIASGYGRGCALLQVQDGQVKQLWENKNMRSQMNGPVLLDGYLYGTDDDQLSCLDLATGEVQWSEKSVGKCSVTAADGKLIVIGDKGKLVIAEATPAEFKVISSAQVLTGKCWTVPVLANGLIYVRNAAGDLVCIDVRGQEKVTSADSPPPDEDRRRWRQWWQELSEEQQQKLRQVWENASEEERAQRAAFREQWNNASEEEKVELRKLRRQYFEKMLEKAGIESPGQARWTQWRGPNRDGKSTETGLLKSWPEGGPKMLWSVQGLGDGYSSISISNGLIYTVGKFKNEGKIFAIDLDGDKKWETKYGKEWTKSVPGVRGTPTVDGDRLYFISGVGVVYCFDAENGDIKWQVNAFEDSNAEYSKWGIAESALIDSEKIFFTPGGQKATMVALDKFTGQTIWTSKSIEDEASYCSPIIVERGGKRIVVNMTASNIIGVHADTGQLLWQYDVEEYIEDNREIHASTPVYSDGCIFVTSGYDMGGVQLRISEDGTSVSKVWSTQVLDNHHGGVVLVDGYLYGSNWRGNPKGDWVCLDWETGEVKFETKWNERKGSIIYADGMLYCYDEKNGIVGLVKATPEKFEVISSFEVELGEDEHWAHPVILNGRLYIRHGEALMAYDIKAG
jgi:outer membrane protein assembly factor BamB